jgi:2',3'-cyclic-nucleotide 2'-phosphodiesterase/3'-nucleotidase
MIAAMNTLGFDASTLGNHEFNYGLPFLMNSVAGAAFPVVCANVATEMGGSATGDTTLVPPYVMLDKTLTDGAGESHPIRIGIIGFVPPQIMTWDRRHLEGNVQVRDIVAAAQAYVPQMREEGPRSSSRSAIPASARRIIHDMMENASVPLAAVDGIDVVLTGHHHRVFPGPDYAETPGVDVEAGTIMGKPAVMAGFWGSHMGLVDLMLERDGNTWRIASHMSEARPIYRREEDRSITALVESDEAVLASVEAEHDATLAYVRAEVGQTDAPLHSYFALVADDPSVQIVSNAQTWYIAQMMAGTENEGLPILSAAAPFKAGGRGGPEYYTDVPRDPSRSRTWPTSTSIPTRCARCASPGRRCANGSSGRRACSTRSRPAMADQVLLNPDFPSYNFDVIDGVTYQIDLSPAVPLQQRRRGRGPGRAPDRQPDVRGRTHRRRAGIHRRDEQLPCGRRRQLPRRQPLDGDLRGAGHQPRRDRALHRRTGYVSPSADANWTFAPMDGHDGPVRHRAGGSGLHGRGRGRGDRGGGRRPGRLHLASRPGSVSRAPRAPRLSWPTGRIRPAWPVIRCARPLLRPRGPFASFQLRRSPT